MINVAPFVYQSFPGLHATADYWQTAFGCPDESSELSIYVSAFIQAGTIFYAMMISLEECIEQEESFFYTVDEILYLHFDHDANKWTDMYEYGDQISINDTKDIYIENVYCASKLKSVPSIAQQQDIINYDKLALKKGEAIIDNVEGIFYDFIDRKLYGNDAHLYYLDTTDGVFDYNRNELIALATFIVEDYDISLQKITVKLLDKRAGQDIDIPIEYYNLDDYPDIDEKYIGKVIPLAYGTIRSSEAICINGLAVGDDPEFSQASILTELGTVQVKIDEEWVTKIPTSTDLTTGIFVLDIADGRNAQGVPYDCRVLGSTGIINTYASDCIIDINYKYLNIQYQDSMYDREEWETEKESLSAIGILYNKKIKLFEAIRQIQAGCNVGFRYEIKADGRRTIRIDDNGRESIFHITKEDIQNIDELPVQSRRDLLASVVKVNYSHDYYEDSDYYIENEDNVDYVLENYRQIRKLFEINSALTAEADAETRAEWHVDRYRDVPKIAEIELRGKQFYNLRIYDIIIVELSPSTIDSATAQIIDGREYYGTWKMKVLSIDPKFGYITNIITGQLIEKIEPIYCVMVDHTGAIFTVGSSGTTTLKWGVRV